MANSCRGLSVEYCYTQWVWILLQCIVPRMLTLANFKGRYAKLESQVTNFMHYEQYLCKPLVRVVWGLPGWTQSLPMGKDDWSHKVKIHTHPTKDIQQIIQNRTHTQIYPQRQTVQITQLQEDGNQLIGRDKAQLGRLLLHVLWPLLWQMVWNYFPQTVQWLQKNL